MRRSRWRGVGEEREAVVIMRIGHALRRATPHSLARARRLRQSRTRPASRSLRGSAGGPWLLAATGELGLEPCWASRLMTTGRWWCMEQAHARVASAAETRRHGTEASGSKVADDKCSTAEAGGLIWPDGARQERSRRRLARVGTPPGRRTMRSATARTRSRSRRRWPRRQPGLQRVEKQGRACLRQQSRAALRRAQPWRKQGGAHPIGHEILSCRRTRRPRATADVLDC